ncbi:MAG: MerR family transcriptional regulator [Acidimicrobiales bacterium]|nr:MerR family transcriptional regulator [Actinomycetota bacterium]
MARGEAVGAGTVGSAAVLRIGEAAEQAGVSCRTLRYYEELGLVVPAGHSAGGARRYTDADVARLQRIRELQELLGFDLGEIRTIMRSEDQLAALRSEYQAGGDVARRKEILAEAMQINARLRAMVKAKRDRLDAMLEDLGARAKRNRVRARDLEAEEAGRPAS